MRQLTYKIGRHNTRTLADARAFEILTGESAKTILTPIKTDNPSKRWNVNEFIKAKRNYEKACKKA